MKTLLLLSIAIAVVSCGSTKITKKKELKPLTKDAKVDVYIKEAPTFRYEVICEAEIESKGNFTSTDRESYASKAKEIARGCGANIAVIKSLSGFTYGSSANVTVRIEAGLKTSEESRFNGRTKAMKQFVSAVTVGNVKNTSIILKKLKVNRDRSKRSEVDEAILGQVMRISAEKGKSCPTKTMYYLYKYYGVTIDYFGNHKGSGRYATTSFVNTNGILNCKSSAVAKSLSKVSNKVEAITAINNSMTTYLNSGVSSTTAKNNYKNMYSTIQKAVNDDCNKDKLGSLCSAKSNLSKIYKACR
ncbi:MAG: hypothetical protein N4A33_07590 [Bacteriovoracaceae bacterium]|jgi:hypothetical protein|nr:hypothetical protein [Bacteriovoracaceae bacterium]